MRVVRPLDREIRKLARAKDTAKKYGCVDMIELADRRLRAAKREKRYRIQQVQRHNHVLREERTCA